MTLEPHEPKQETLIRLTPQGQRLAGRLASQTPKEQERTMRVYMDRAKQAAREERESRKRMILEMLRDANKCERDRDGNFILLEKICSALDVTAMEAMLLLHEINGNQLEVPEGERYVYCFFNHGSGEVWVELWEPD